jgi:plasmid stabilization system protein ParE
MDGEYEVAFTPHASTDLEQIVCYIARDDFAAARRFGEKLVGRALSLGKLAISRSGARLPKRPGVRKLNEGPYLILYRIYPAQNKVRVLRFWHGAQDLSRLKLGT